MRIFIFTYDRPDIITTSEYFKDFEHIVLCHDNYNRDRYLEHGRIHGDLIATQEPKGLANNRNYALKMMEPDEWALFFVDDLVDIFKYQGIDENKTGKIQESEGNINKLFKTTIQAEEFIERSKYHIERCKEEEVHLGGFACYENPYFLSKRYKTFALADGRCWVMHKHELTFDTNTQLADDLSFTLKNLKHYGKVLLDQWLIPKCKRYSRGAYGTKDQRMEQRIRECEYLVETYPDLAFFYDKPGWPEHSHIRIRYKKPIKVDKDQVSMF